MLILTEVTAISGRVASLLATRWAGSSAWYALDGAEERPVRKALPEEPEGRGSESRPVHHYQIMLGWVQITPSEVGDLNLLFGGLSDDFGCYCRTVENAGIEP